MARKRGSFERSPEDAMKTDQTLLKRHLLAHGGSERGVERALATLAPFFAIAEAGSYPLGRASFADVGEIVTALWHAGKLHARGCVFLASCIRHRAPLLENAAE